MNGLIQVTSADDSDVQGRRRIWRLVLAAVQSGTHYFRDKTVEPFAEAPRCCQDWVSGFKLARCGLLLRAVCRYRVLLQPVDVVGMGHFTQGQIQYLC